MFVLVDGCFRAQKCRRGPLWWRRDEMFLEVARPVRREPAWTTPLAQLQRPLEMAEFHTEPGERCERVNDEPTPVAGVVIALIGIRPRLEGAVDTDLVGDPLFFPPGMGFTGLGARWGVAEGTANERLLHHSPSASSRPAVQPWWKTANCVAESNTVLLGP